MSKRSEKGRPGRYQERPFRSQVDRIDAIANLGSGRLAALELGVEPIVDLLQLTFIEIDHGAELLQSTAELFLAVLLRSLCLGLARDLQNG